MNVVTVQCLICGAPMEMDRIVARATHHYESPASTDLIRYCCHTPDCGNCVIVEGS